MKHWRGALVLLLFALPIVLFVGVGAAALWQTGRLSWIWWCLPACWGLALLLSRCWRRQIGLPGPSVQLPLHWTSRDQDAWQIVQQQQAGVTELPRSQLIDLHFYLQSAIDLSLEIARRYHPQARDPVGSLTVPEILAAAQLALEDSTDWIRDYLPGSQLLTVDQWRLLGKAPGWIRLAGNASWVLSVLANPVNAGRYLASKWTMDSASKQLQENALGWFYAVFIRHVGFYLIEMNSGRLRGGALKYRELQRQLQPQHRLHVASPKVVSHPPSDPPAAVEVTLAVVGQVNAGKSSLVNALLGESRATVDVLPSTESVTRHQLAVADRPERLIVLDTAGYGDGSDQRLEETMRAAQQADLLLWVASATNAARRTDLEALQELQRRVGVRRNNKLPPTLAVLTHIDQLPPALEWAPPYNWRNPARTKEHSIAGAVQFTEQELQKLAVAVIPVCARGEEVYGVQEELLPVVISLLDEARACSLVRALHQDLDHGQVGRVFRQLANLGRGVLQACLTEPDGRPPGRRGE